MMNIKPFARKVQYYETDMMGVAHHANYIHWMEEARVDFLDQIGHPYKRMEDEGILSPVRALSCQYRRPCTFGDELQIAVEVEAFNGVVLTMRYVMRKGEELICEAHSEHVFARRSGGLVRMKRDMPEFCAVLEALLKEQNR